MLPVSPMSLNQFTRDLWGSYDAAAIAQLAGLAGDVCYIPKLYKVPDDSQEVIPAGGHVTCGLEVTPGSLIVGFCLPCLAASGNIGSTAPLPFLVQITDQSVKIDSQPHRWFSDPLASLFLSNYKPEFESQMPPFFATVFPLSTQGSFPHLFRRPYPVVGSGRFTVELWVPATASVIAAALRIQLVFLVLEVCRP